MVKCIVRLVPLTGGGKALLMPTSRHYRRHRVRLAVGGQQAILVTSPFVFYLSFSIGLYCFYVWSLQDSQQFNFRVINSRLNVSSEQHFTKCKNVLCDTNLF